MPRKQIQGKAFDYRALGGKICINSPNSATQNAFRLKISGLCHDLTAEEKVFIRQDSFDIRGIY